MKDNPITAALGDIDPAYIAEAEAAWQSAAPRRHPRARVLLCAALIAAAVCIVGFTAASRFYFAPGVGIIDDASITAPRVWACYDEIKLGDKIIETVVLSEQNGTGTLAVWYWDDSIREVKLHSEEGILFEAMRESFLDMRNRMRAMVTLNGVQFKPTAQSGGTKGLQYCFFQKFPVAETVYLRDADNNTATIPLTLIDESRYAHIDGNIQISDEINLSLVPISGSDTLFAAQLTDPFIAALSRDFIRMNTQVQFNTTYTSGETGRAGGFAIVTGTNNAALGGSAVRISRSDTGDTVREMALRSVYVQLISVAAYDNAPLFPITIPPKGEGYDCDLILYDGHGITCRLTHVEYGEEGLVFTAAAEDNTDSPLIHELSCTVLDAYHLGDYESFFMNNPDKSIKKTDYPRRINYDTKTGELYCLTADDEERAERVVLNPGDEIVISIGRISFRYLPEGDESAVFGAITLD